MVIYRAGWSMLKITVRSSARRGAFFPKVSSPSDCDTMLPPPIGAWGTDASA